MIFGIGVDQVDIKRVRSLLEKSGSKFENRCFTVDEIFTLLGLSDEISSSLISRISKFSSRNLT